MPRTPRTMHWGFLAAGFVLLVASSVVVIGARQAAPQPVSIDADDLGGVVTGPKGPEAGVWVIAETTDLPTRLVKIVVTDNRGQYVVPDLHKANYDVWVRGYGLVDSPKTKTAPGKIVNLTAVVAPPRAAAEIFAVSCCLSRPSPQERVSRHCPVEWIAPTLHPGVVAQHQFGRLTAAISSAHRDALNPSAWAFDHPSRHGSLIHRVMRGADVSG